MQTNYDNPRNKRRQAADGSEMSEYSDIDFFANTERLQFEDRETFKKACDEYLNNPRVIDIGYSDMVIILESSNSTSI